MLEATSKNGTSPRYKTLAVVAVAAIGIPAVATATTITAPPATVKETLESPAPAVSARAAQSVESLLARGQVLTHDQATYLKSSPAVTSNGGNIAEARAVTPPPGAEKGQPWFVVPASDNSGRVCLDTVTTGVACGSPQILASTGIATSRVRRPETNSKPGSGASVWSAGGTALFSGIVAADVVDVVALDSRGEVTHKAEVINQAYNLETPTDDLASVEFRKADGSTSGTISLAG